MSALTIGLSGLLVNQRMLDLTGQNITNANTPNYHNEVAHLAENVATSPGGASVGTGVAITDITRDVNQALEQAVVSNTSSSQNASTQLNGLNQLQSYLATGSGTLHDDLGNLFNQLETLTTEPSDPTQRQLVVSAANDVTNQLNATAANVNQMSSALTNQVNTSIASINTFTAQIAQLNQQIHDATISGADTNGLLDQRDQALAGLSQLVGVSTLAQSDGQMSIFSNGSPLVLDNQSATLSTALNNQGQILINSSVSTQPIAITGGQLGGALTLYNTTVPAIQGQLNTFAQALAGQFDQIQATGLGLNGPMTSLTSQRTVANTNQPLASDNLAFPPQAGNLSIGVTNLATGQRTVTQVAIDPKTQSLADVANAISAVPNLQAVVNPQAGTLNLLAGNGYAFDFTGNGVANPDSANLLPALGLNSFFVGNSADNLAVNPSLLNNPSQLATSTTGQPGDGSNLAKMVALQTQPVLAGNTQSLQQFLEGIIGNVGTQAADQQTSSTAYTALGSQLNDQLQSTTGVDQNQTLMQLVQYQQSYEMSAHFISSVNETLQSLYNIFLPTNG